MAQWLVKKLSTLMRVSVRTLHHYDEIGLLKPSIRLDNGYRLYSETDLQRLQQIVALKFLGFDLTQIKKMLSQASSLPDQLRLQSTLLQKKARALLDASTALDAVIAQCEEHKSVDWQTIVNLTEVYSMIDALRETGIASMLNDGQLRQLVDYYTAVAKEPAAATLLARQSELLTELKGLIATDPAGERGRRWAEQWVSLTQQMVCLPVVRNSPALEVMTVLFGDFDKKSEEEQLRIGNLMREAGTVVGEKFGISELFPDVSPAMILWMTKAMQALFKTH